MIDYAVTLEFDKETENIIQELIDEVAKVTGCDYMKQSKIPPHVTVSALVSDNEAALLAEMESIAEDVRKIAHVTSMVSISKTKQCKEKSIAIYSQLAIREGEPITKRIIATQCLYLGRPVLDSHWEDEVELEENKDESENRKRKRK